MSEGTGVLPKYWTEDRDVTGPAILTFREHFLRGLENTTLLYICCGNYGIFEEESACQK